MPRTHFKNLKGCRFGRLKVVKETEERKGTHIVWECHCRCGSIIFVCGNNLTSGNTLSCGCWQREIAARPNGKRREFSDENFR